MRRMTRERRKLGLTFLVAGLGAIIADHILKPGLKKRFKL